MTLALMYVLCMASKTISVSVEAYDKLRNARRYKGESFTQVIMRGQWPEDSVTARELLEFLEKAPPFFSDEELDAIERAKEQDLPPTDKWRKS